MTCPKCQGLMVEDVAADMTAGQIQLIWHCVNCSQDRPRGPLRQLVPATARLEDEARSITVTPALAPDGRPPARLTPSSTRSDAYTEENRRRVRERYHQLHPNARYYKPQEATK